jgi:hypothetical protein
MRLSRVKVKGIIWVVSSFNRIGVLIKRGRFILSLRLSLFPSSSLHMYTHVSTVRRQPSASQEKPSPEPCRLSDLGIPASITVRK